MIRVSLLLFVVNCFALPGKVVMRDAFTQLPVISERSLELKKCRRVSLITRGMSREVRKRVAERGRTKKWYDVCGHLVVMTTKNLARTPFMKALHAGFFDELAPIEALIVDHMSKVRGYMMPMMEWQSGVHRDAGFLERLERQSTQTGFTFSNLRPESVAVAFGAICLVDLDEVVAQ